MAEHPGIARYVHARARCEQYLQQCVLIDGDAAPKRPALTMAEDTPKRHQTCAATRGTTRPSAGDPAMARLRCVAHIPYAFARPHWGLKAENLADRPLAPHSNGAPSNP